MPINVNDPEYTQAEKDYYEAPTAEAKLIALKKMISHAPKHKGGENLRQQLTTRRKKLEQEIVKAKRSGKSTQIGIKKGEMQAVIVGKTNSGKSSLLKKLTKANPVVSENKFITVQPTIGMMDFNSVQIQLIEIPAIDSDHYDKSLVHTADTVILIVEKFEEIEEIKKELNATGKIVIAFNKTDKLSENEKRKLASKLQSKKYNFVLMSTLTEECIEDLKEKLFLSFDRIRVYTKEQDKPPEEAKTRKPLVLKPGSTVKDVAEKILSGFSKKVKTTKIWGPSSKFSGQIVSLKHQLKDLDIVEFKTK